MPRIYQRPAPLQDVLEEYLEEGAFLYGRRRLCLTDAELDWDDLRQCEDRLEAHIQGLVLGGARSAALLKPKLTLDEEGDPGEAFVAAAVYPSLGLVEPMQWLMSAVSGDPPHLEAIIDGLSYSRDDRLEGWIDDFLAHESPVVRRMGVEVRARRWRKGCEGPLSRLVNDPDDRVCLAATGVLLREGILTGAAGAGSRLGHEDPDVVVRAAWILAETGDATLVPWIRTGLATVPPDRGARLGLLLAVTGHPSDYQRLVALMNRLPQLEGDLLLALGLAGSAEAVPLLIQRLEEPQREFRYMMACNALVTLSGVGGLPGFDLEDAPDEEVRAYKDGWVQWWSAKQKELAAPTKWRLGRPLSPLALCDDLARPGNPRRDLTFLELKARYGCPEAWSPAARHETQTQQLARIRGWAETAEKDFKPGQTYLGRKPAS